MKKQIAFARLMCLQMIAVGFVLSPLLHADTPALIPSAAPDWPQWRGPRRDGISDDKNLLQQWPEGGPKLLWTATGIGRGYSSPILVDDAIYITGDEEKDLAISAFSLTGERIWKTSNGQSWTKSFPGSRSSCAYDDGRIYHLNAHGRLACLEAATGKEIWARGILEQFEAKNIMWGISESPIVHGDSVFATPAGSKGLMVALDKRTGKTIWAAEPLEGERASYSSPILAQLGDRSVLINGGAEYLFAVDAQSGELIWKLPQVDPDNTVNTTPVLNGQMLLLTNSSRGFGAAYGVKMTGESAARTWTTELTISHGGTVCIDGQLCGSSGRGEVRGWVNIDANTGKARQVGELPGGSVIYADGCYYCLTDRGAMNLRKMNNGKFETVGSFQLAEGKDAWAHPVVCRGLLLLRYHDTLYCYDVRR